MDTLLVVDDDDGILKLFESALKTSFRVLTAPDGAAGKSVLEREDVACVVADQMMPGLTGVELLREAVTLRPYAARILVTASDRVKDLSDAVNLAQVHRFLSKPVRITELIGVVKSAVHQASLERENQRLVGELTEKNGLLQRALSQVQDSERRLEREVEERTRQLREANVELEKLALRDGLTGLYNHRFFQDAMTQEMSRAARYGNPLSLVFIDVDHFKNYNDLCGHPAGDALLKDLGRLLTATQDAPEFRFRGRASDIVSRYGGEEFCIILPMTEGAGALVRADRVREMVSQHPFERREVQPNGVISVSVGVASYPKDALDKAGLIKAADDAMLAAKRAGRNRVVSAPS
ncbi:MAG: diguanylate cyclase [Deltaproteobacteria bacterium]|nr:diguanylate cyclase [Deltaproteobacteria bacterium]